MHRDYFKFSYYQKINLSFIGWSHLVVGRCADFSTELATYMIIQSVSNAASHGYHPAFWAKFSWNVERSTGKIDDSWPFYTKHKTSFIIH